MLLLLLSVPGCCQPFVLVMVSVVILARCGVQRSRILLASEGGWRPSQIACSCIIKTCFKGRWSLPQQCSTRDRQPLSSINCSDAAAENRNRVSDADDKRRGRRGR